MYGVVLWSDKKDSKAVIWCEDHGDLAFYSGGADCGRNDHALDAGDLVSFSVSEGADIRMATNPKLIAEQQYPGLAESLMAKGVPSPAGPVAAASQAGKPQGDCNVIQFTPRDQRARLAS